MTGWSGSIIARIMIRTVRATMRLPLPFDLTLTEGYPACYARVGYDGQGYRAYMGWIQIVTNHDLATGSGDHLQRYDANA